MSGTDAGREAGIHSKHAVTQLLQSSRAGNRDAVNELLPLVYEEMCDIARQKLRFERNHHTLDTTALVHEAYFRLINHDEVEWQSRTHFLAIAALAMKRILINYAERRKAFKRGGSFSKADDTDPDKVPDKGMEMSESMADEILALNEALNRMETFNERGSRVVEYHFFGGLTWNEISEVMGVAPVTVRRAWNIARLWLRRELSETGLPDLSPRKQL